MVMGQLDTHDARLGAGLEAALGWWREAGVDCAFIDAPQDWLAAENPAPERKAAAGRQATNAPAPGRSASSAPEAAPIAADRTNWPLSLGAFAPWWLSEPSLAPCGLTRVLPSGPDKPALMVLVPMPAEDDGDILLSGKTGKLLNAMLAAFGIDSAQIYRASALPARIALPDWAAMASAGLGAVLAHHVALVSPQRLLVFGKTDISALLGHGSAHNAPNLHQFNHDSGTIPVGFEYDLETFLAKPGWKAGVWQRWLDGCPPEPSGTSGHGEMGR